MSPLISLTDAAAELGVSRQSVYVWALRGWIRSEHIAGRYLIPCDALAEFRAGAHGHRAKRST